MSFAAPSADHVPHRAPGSGGLPTDRSASPAPTNHERILSGRTRITPRALDRLVGAVSADALGVDPRAVAVSLGDFEGRLVVSISAPIRVVPLTRVTAGVGMLVRDGGPLLERAALAQDRIRARAAELTGYDIERVAIRLRDAQIQSERRAK